ncbi:MAG: ATP-binding protein, partial [Bacteroidota bacterium]
LHGLFVEEMGQTKRKYEIEKKEHQISLLKKENELLVSNEKIQELKGYIFAIVSLLFFLLILWIALRLSSQRKVNKLLGEKNRLLNSKNQEIAIKNKQLEYSNHDLQQFAYVASHDLKEPLRMIHSYTNLLDRKYQHQLDESGKEFMFFITDAVGRMQTLLDDLLDYSRCGKQDTPTQLVDVGDVMILVEANLKHRLESKNAQLIVHRENLPVVKAHRTQVVQLLQNLVGNGLKFNKKEQPQVIVDCQRKDNSYEFSIRDNGIGISKENFPKVFDMFKRLHTRVEFEGTGIGLATCKRIVSNMGGEIWVESKEGEGSTFFFSIPCPVEEMVTI